MATKSANAYVKKTPIRKVTSIGRYAKPTNKHKRRSNKTYRGQGRV